MEALWNWHENGTNMYNIDEFIEGLKKANEQKKYLYRDQLLNAGQVAETAGILTVLAKENPEMTKKVALAAVEMNHYLNNHYSDTQKTDLKVDKLTLPAMLKALKPQMQQYVTDGSLRTKISIIVSRADSSLQNEAELIQEHYHNCVKSYREILYGENKPTRPAMNTDKQAPGIEIVKIKKKSQTVYSI